jgi:hypothetical protein
MGLLAKKIDVSLSPLVCLTHVEGHEVLVLVPVANAISMATKRFDLVVSVARVEGTTLTMLGMM